MREQAVRFVKPQDPWPPQWPNRREKPRARGDSRSTDAPREWPRAACG